MEVCYKCNGELKGEYQVMIYDPDLKFVKCCSEDCAESLKSENANYLHELYLVVNNQCIQILKKENIAPEKLIERFIKEYNYNFTVEDILDCYQNKFMKGYQSKVSFKMIVCIDKFEKEIRSILGLD